MSIGKSAQELNGIIDKQPTEKELEMLEIFFKAIADPTRLKILTAISNVEECDEEDCDCGICVQDISTIVEMSQSAVSHQLRVLRHANLIKKKKQGKHVFYSLSDNHVTGIIAQSMEHIHE